MEQILHGSARTTAVKGLTPYEYVCKIWTKKPERFNVKPLLHNVGLNTLNRIDYLF
ncbi:MAG: hypothetical protein H6861_08055 [Rhodospirillales bacterium]|nr:hypothetical protein [Rhodospirillales bacterium]